MKVFETFSEDETEELSYKLGELLQKGDMIFLNGDLGTGKTAFASGVAHALGIPGHITSPTFTLVNEYKGRLPLYHFDVYRIADPDEMYEIGFEEYMDGSGIVIIEWADRIGDLLPQEGIRVNLRKDLQSGNNKRVIQMQFNGDRYKEFERMLERKEGWS